MGKLERKLDLELITRIEHGSQAKPRQTAQERRASRPVRTKSSRKGNPTAGRSFTEYRGWRRNAGTYTRPAYIDGSHNSPITANKSHRNSGRGTEFTPSDELLPASDGGNGSDTGNRVTSGEESASAN